MPKRRKGAAAACAAALSLGACGLPADTVRDTIKDYYHLTDEIAHALSDRLGNSPEYQLIRVPGPDYEVGSILVGKEGADRLTRRCLADGTLIGINAFPDLPTITTGRTMKIAGKSKFQPLPADVIQRLAGVGIEVRTGELLTYSLQDMRQELIDRDDLVGLIEGNPDCRAFFARSNEPNLIVVRGKLWGTERIESRNFSNVDVGGSFAFGSFEVKYDSDRGSFSAVNRVPQVKFYIVANIRVAHDRLAAGTSRIEVRRPTRDQVHAIGGNTEAGN